MERWLSSVNFLAPQVDTIPTCNYALYANRSIEWLSALPSIWDFINLRTYQWHYYRFDGERYNISAVLVIILRVLCGMSSGIVAPSAMNLIGRWFPKYERSRAVSLLYTGEYVSYQYCYWSEILKFVCFRIVIVNRCIFYQNLTDLLQASIETTTLKYFDSFSL